jgi:predicted acylesterase/phospholipase RssA
MLTLEPAKRPRAGKARLAIALAGGGPLGFYYELGALHALAEAIEGRDLTQYDVYVGVSSGSLIAAALASGFDTAAMGSMFVRDESTLFPFSPGILLQPALREYLRRLEQLPRVVSTIVRQCARDPRGIGWSAVIGALGRLLPTAVFDNEPLRRYLETLFSSPGRTDDFRKLRPKLYVVATNLNTGESVPFGAPGHDRVPISRALLASTALPGLYPAVAIAGEHYVDGALIRTMNASLALEAGCNLVICINPLVPFDASHAPASQRLNLADEGLAAVLGQTFRALIYSRMKVGMATYGARFPQATTLLLEPDRHDERLFFTNVFRYTERHKLVNHSYQCTRRDLLAQADALGPLLERRGLRLNLKALQDPHRSFLATSRERLQRSRDTVRRLNVALTRLERILAAPRGTG